MGLPRRKSRSEKRYWMLAMASQSYIRHIYKCIGSLLNDCMTLSGRDGNISIKSVQTIISYCPEGSLRSLWEYHGQN